MCGINGFIQPHGEHQQKLNNLKSMNDALTHRGPDDEGTWNYQEYLYIGHRRLSIIDLSSAGHQPMQSHSGRSSIVLNGEIYNYKELSDRLDVPLRGHSDTEVLLEYLEKFGVDKTLADVRGMFAFAYFLESEKQIVLARDPFGEKPLYYGKSNGTFLFSSELKAIAALPDFKREINPAAASLYFKYNYVPSPLSIYKGIYKLSPGHSITVTLDGEAGTEKNYFNKGYSENTEYSEAEANLKIEELLEQSISRQMVADVPLGVLLSSGVDSSLIAALIQKRSSQRVKSFTIGFSQKDYDESTVAKRIAQHLKLEHTEYICSSSDLLDQAQNISDIYDEPFSDSSQIPTLLLSKLTRKNVTVALSGDGGDEVFAGYNRYKWLEKSLHRIHKIPKSIRPLSQRGLQLLNRSGLVNTLPIPYAANKVDKLMQLMSSGNLTEAFEVSISNQHLPGLTNDTAIDFSHEIHNTQDMMVHDQNHYLPDDILVKVDRASMAHSLETRAPYLDVDLYNFCKTLPLHFKIDASATKKPLRNMLKKYLSEDLRNAPKKGFAVPIDSWFRGELKTWTHDMLSTSSIKSQGFLNASVVDQYLREHMSGKKNWQFQIWNLLVFQSWLAKWL